MALAVVKAEKSNSRLGLAARFEENTKLDNNIQNASNKFPFEDIFHVNFWLNL